MYIYIVFTSIYTCIERYKYLRYGAPRQRAREGGGLRGAHGLGGDIF